jgi:hypothetical protein
MASTILSSTGGALSLGIAGDASPAGADTVYGFTGNDTLSTGGQRAPGGDRFLDDAAGAFDAALGYALAFQHLLAEAWKGEASIVLRHLDQGGSCAPLSEAERALAEPDATTGGTAASELVIEHVAPADSDDIADGPAGGDGNGDFADAGIAGGDFFGMT